MNSVSLWPGRIAACCVFLAFTLPAATQEEDFFDDTLPPPGFAGSQPDFFDLPDDDLDLDFDDDPFAELKAAVAEPPEVAGDPGETAALKLELPEPYFGGTPLDYSGPYLEKPNYKSRPDFMAPGDVTKVSQGKTVTSSAPAKWGALSMLVDGDAYYGEDSVLGLPVGPQWVQIDFGGAHELFALALWHFHEGERVYFDVVVQVADDAAFTRNVRTLFNNDHDNSSGLGAGEDMEYIEDNRGKFLGLGPVKASAIRFYSDGNTTDDFNHYVEAEVFGKPAN